MTIYYKALTIFFACFFMINIDCYAISNDAICCESQEICDALTKAREQKEQILTETIDLGMERPDNKMADFSCLKDLWQAGSLPGLGDLMNMLKDSLCSLSRNTVTGAVNLANDTVKSLLDGAKAAADALAQQRLQTMTGGIMASLDTLEDLSSLNGAQRNIDDILGNFQDDMTGDYDDILYSD